jgi:dTDP-glucose 4,6-dehydratase/UDP-glucose 4-epimerase
MELQSSSGPRHILVTGGTGFVGSYLVRSLLRRGAQVRSLDDDSRGSREKLGELAARVELRKGDIRDRIAVSEAVRGMDCVCHLAYINGTEYFYSKPELVLDVAVRGMMNVLDACIEHGVRDLLLASSSEVYQTPPRVPTDETVPLSVPDPLNPRYSYGGGKIISELLAINYGRKHFDRVAIFRPHNVYGPQMGWEHAIPQLVKRLHELSRGTRGTVRLPIQGTGQERRAFIHADDAAAGIVRILERGEHLQIYHVGTEEEVTIEALATAIGKWMGREVEIVPGPLQPGGTLRRCPDISKLRRLGFEPKIPLREGLEITVRWMEEQLNQARNGDG